MTTAPSSPSDLPTRVVASAVALATTVRREVVLARFIGKLAVDQGIRELRERVLPPQPAERADADPVADVVAASASTAGAAAADAAPVVSADHLALVDYDHLSSSQVVAKLAGLDRAEREQIATYERAHRHRRTILGKLDELAELDEVDEVVAP